ncbi:SusC/RagA family TonB-linked outer membrane protein [Sphingobacterium arenae]|uniref:TonB-dependent receptor n=1 Tax=Sphingobacterium arenae TaxID=1280598 RepID=A0ABR7Y3A2_9SPHI|nr:TonB-dependent receptor [Sphingobacterium arenae]MBD1425743.1 TonB-dependent receptor [Sphingobacterium arenae]
MKIKPKLWSSLILICISIPLIYPLSLSASVYEVSNTIQYSVKGRIVSDDNNTPLEGVNVTVKGTSFVTTTDKQGRFVLTDVQEDATIILSRIGYVRKEIPLRGKKELEVALVEEASLMEEIVVVGYGEVLKKDLTGSVGQVRMDDIVKAPVASFTEALAGRVAGVQVSSNDGQPGEAMNIVVRGGNSLTQDNSPLYVIDGFPVEAEDAILNPDDIASINVLKDASATAIYGARGANGVVVVETKKGQIGNPVITYNGSYGSQQVTKKMDLLNPYEFVKYHYEFNPTLTEERYFVNGRDLESYRLVTGYDWQDKVTRTAPIQIHNIALRGGGGRDAQTRYSLSGSLYDQKGVIINSGYERAQVRASVEQIVNEKLTAGLNINYSSVGTHGQPVAIGESGSATSNLFYGVWGYRPITGNNIDLEDEFLDPEDFSGADLRINPIINANNTLMASKRNDLLLNSFVSYKILPELTLKVTGSYKGQVRRTDRFYNSLTSRGSNRNPNNTRGVNGSVEHQEVSTWLNENTLTYRKQFKKDHRIEALGGITMQGNNFGRYGFAAMNVPNEELGISGLDEGIPYSNTSLKSTSTLGSVLGRVNYHYQSKYYATVSFRADGSSKFPSYNRWGYFPSAALAWTVSREKFMQNLSFITNAKIRASFGTTGNNRVGDFVYLPSFTMNTYDGYSFNNGTPQPIITPNNLGNAKLKWETTQQIDMGMDLSLFNGRVDFTADLYRKTTRDLLLNASVPYTTGYAAVYSNIGSVRNEGLELTISSVNINTPKFKWESSFNIAFNRNKILELAENEDNRLTALPWEYAYAQVPLYMARLGSPAAMFYGFVFDGIYQLEDFDKLANGSYVLKGDVADNGNARSLIKPGDIRYKDVNGDGTVNAYDQTILGKPIPLHIGGFANNFSYDAFQLHVFFQWSYGNDVYNANRIIFEGERPRANLNQFASVIDRWTPENPSNTIPRAGGNAPVGTYSSRVIEDGSFLRLKTVALSYTLPSALTSKVALKKLSIDLTAQNLWTWTNYSGMDPEVSVRNSVLTPGFDYAPYPRSRTFVVGLKATL